MKRSEIVLITVTIISLIVLIIISGIFYFNLILNTSTTGHVVVQKSPENSSNIQEERKDISTIENNGNLQYDKNQ